MRIVHALAASVAVMLAGGTLRLLDIDTHGAASAAAAEESDPSQQTFRLTGIGRDWDCVLSAADRMEPAARPLQLSPGCSAVDPALAGQAFWRERPEGSVSIEGPDGRIVLEFAASDGAAYESYSPADPVMILTAAD